MVNEIDSVIDWKKTKKILERLVENPQEYCKRMLDRVSVKGEIVKSLISIFQRFKNAAKSNVSQVSNIRGDVNICDVFVSKTDYVESIINDVKEVFEENPNGKIGILLAVSKGLTAYHLETYGKLLKLRDALAGRLVIFVVSRKPILGEHRWMYSGISTEQQYAAFATIEDRKSQLDFLRGIFIASSINGEAWKGAENAGLVYARIPRYQILPPPDALIEAVRYAVLLTYGADIHELKVISNHVILPRILDYYSILYSISSPDVMLSLLEKEITKLFLLDVPSRLLPLVVLADRHLDHARSANMDDLEARIEAVRSIIQTNSILKREYYEYGAAKVRHVKSRKVAVAPFFLIEISASLSPPKSKYRCMLLARKAQKFLYSDSIDEISIHSPSNKILVNLTMNVCKDIFSSTDEVKVLEEEFKRIKTITSKAEHIMETKLLFSSLLRHAFDILVSNPLAFAVCQAHAVRFGVSGQELARKLGELFSSAARLVTELVSGEKREDVASSIVEAHAALTELYTILYTCLLLSRVVLLHADPVLVESVNLGISRRLREKLGLSNLADEDDEKILKLLAEGGLNVSNVVLEALRLVEGEKSYRDFWNGYVANSQVAERVSKLHELLASNVENEGHLLVYLLGGSWRDAFYSVWVVKSIGELEELEKLAEKRLLTLFALEYRYLDEQTRTKIIEMFWKYVERSEAGKASRSKTAGKAPRSRAGYYEALKELASRGFYLDLEGLGIPKNIKILVDFAAMFREG